MHIGEEHTHWVRAQGLHIRLDLARTGLGTAERDLTQYFRQQVAEPSLANLLSNISKSRRAVRERTKFAIMRLLVIADRIALGQGQVLRLTANPVHAGMGADGAITELHM